MLGIWLALPVVVIQLMGFAGGMLTVGAVVVVAMALRGAGEVLVMVLTGIALDPLVPFPAEMHCRATDAV